MRPALFLLASLAACQSPVPTTDSTEKTEPSQLVSYTVNAEQASEAAFALNMAIGDLGHVGQSGDTLVVTAPASIQAGIPEFLEKTASPTSKVTQSDITIEYWAVEATLTDGVDDKTLAPLTTALTAIETDAGIPLTFTMLARNVVRSVPGDSAGVLGENNLFSEQYAHVDSTTGNIVADLELGIGLERPKARIRTKPNTWVVLSEVDHADKRRYYIVRAKLD